MSPRENELIQRAKAGEEEALETIFRLHVEAAVRLAYLITRNWASAEDAVQEAFIQAFRSLASFREGRPFKPWFTKIVVNKSIRAKEQGPRPYQGEEPNPHRLFQPEKRALDKEGLQALFAAINSLDEGHRLPLLLKYLSGLTEAETGAALGLPVSTVKSRLYTARQRLKKQLEN